MMKQVTLPWIPDYFTIALYQQSQFFVAHELQSNLYCRNVMMLLAIKDLSKLLISIQLQEEQASKKGWIVKRTPARPASQQAIERVRKVGIILRNVVIEP